MTNLKIGNIGIIKSANIKFNGLTLIAGENDTGKSTVGKTLFSIIKSHNVFYSKNRVINNKVPRNRISLETAFDRSNRLIFDSEISENGKIDFQKDNLFCKIEIENHSTKSFQTNAKYPLFKDATIIQSPAIFDMIDFFGSITKMNLENSMYGSDFDIKYPYILWDLYKKLTIQKRNGYLIPEITQATQNMIEGKIKQENEIFSYFKYRHSQEIKYKLDNTAFGIKSIGILQVLNQQQNLNKNSIFVFDEPEVHLHPKWQLHLAKILIILVKNGIKIIINSHSPYFIEALRKYGADINLQLGKEMNFYLAEKSKDNDLLTEIRDVNSDINLIFQRLAQPMQDLVWS